MGNRKRFAAIAQRHEQELEARKVAKMTTNERYAYERSKLNPTEIGPIIIDDVTIKLPDTPFAQWRLPPVPSDKQYRRTHPACEAAISLFYRGGRLSDHGFVRKTNIPERTFNFALKEILQSWEPSHEDKMAIAGWLIDKCCDRIPEDANTFRRSAEKPIV